MLGLAFLFAFSVYLLISIGIVVYAVRKARARGIAGWKWGVPAALVMYLIVFWDHIPTVVAHEYYCEKEAGFEVYKTLEQWKEENPGVAEKLTYKEISDLEKYGDDYVYHINERFDWRIDSDPIFLSIRRIDNQIVDTADDEVLAQYIDFKTGWGSIAIGADKWREYKVWLVNRSCEKEGNRESAKRFSQFRISAKKIGGA